jgi:hypothetical protein
MILAVTRSNRSWPKPHRASSMVTKAAAIAAALVVTGAPGLFVTDPVGRAEAAGIPEWSLQSSNNEGGSLYDVSCASANDCTAVGRIWPTGTLAKHWNGSSWTVQATPNPGPAGEYDYLRGVSCTSSSACTAVGYTATEGFLPSEVLVERWSGGEWSVQSAPVPVGASRSMFYDVSCASSSECVAVGNYRKSTGVNTQEDPLLIERWTGGEWFMDPSPTAGSGNGNYLYDVSCASGTSCMAVGEIRKQGSSVLPLVEHWNGINWTGEPLSLSPEAKAGGLTGVSCSSQSSCMAVGWFNRSAESGRNGQAVAIRWNGSEWTSPTIFGGPAFSEYRELNGISCLTATECEAVGQAVASTGGARTFVAGWNGIGWSEQSSPNPPPYSNSENFLGVAKLNRVSCVSPLTCMAAGWSLGALALRYGEPIPPYVGPSTGGGAASPPATTAPPPPAGTKTTHPAGGGGNGQKQGARNEEAGSKDGKKHRGNARKCRKGFKAKKVNGKQKCVRAKKHGHHSKKHNRAPSLQR